MNAHDCATHGALGTCGPPAHGVQLWPLLELPESHLMATFHLEATAHSKHSQGPPKLLSIQVL